MAKRCCYYERDGGKEKKTICTTDDKCPDLGAGWNRIGSWGVEDCDDCFKSRDCASTGDTGTPRDVSWQTTTLAKLRTLIPADATLWIGTPAAGGGAVGAGKAADQCFAIANIVICAGTCSGGKKCLPEKGKFIDCTCQ